MESLQQRSSSGEQKPNTIEKPGSIQQVVDLERAREAAERICARAILHASGDFDWNRLKRDRDDGRP
jgi:precorrin isomerase